jgi:hypothetical protein
MQPPLVDAAQGSGFSLKRAFKDSRTRGLNPALEPSGALVTVIVSETDPIRMTALSVII